jgi:exodeoxyribonuclease V alpha subunit
MATHLSARLTWHEDAWNGRICRHPALNAACMVHEHVRNARKDEIEEAHRGEALGVVSQI